ncbi:MAG: DUF1588 domain-containing protein [Deltaproteobacteria bacterium]|nr:DUF1588 domain-containing protein [Deltaproteobacteria bacterium]
MLTRSNGNPIIGYALASILWAGGCSGQVEGINGQGGSGEPAAVSLALRTTTSRLTDAQYRNTLVAVTGLPMSAFSPLPKAAVLGKNYFDNNIEALEISNSFVAQLNSNAVAAANALSPRDLAPCAQDADSKACGLDFIRSFGQRAFRRPLDTAESERFSKFFDGAVEQFGYDEAVRLTVTAFLQAPEFAYLIEETGEPNDRGEATLTPYSLASRLSYTLTQGPPDDELIANVEGLGDAVTLRKQIDRLLSEGKAGGAVRDFFRGWLHIQAASYERKKAAFDGLTVEQNSSVPESLSRFANQVFWEQGGRLDRLFSSNKAFVNPALASLWDVPMSGDQWQEVDLQTDRFSGGLLTQPAWLAMVQSPKSLYRGLFVLERLLCVHVPPPPPNIVLNLGTPDQELDGKPLTDRQRLELVHEKQGTNCGACHATIDPPGFAFEHFDEVGRWRDQDNGQTIDSSGELNWDTDVDGPFDDGLQLAKKLQNSRTLQACVARQWFRFLHGRAEEAEGEADAKAIEGFAKILEDTGGNMRNLVKEILASPSFRTRPWTLERPQ